MAEEQVENYDHDYLLLLFIIFCCPVFWQDREGFGMFQLVLLSINLNQCVSHWKLILCFSHSPLPTLYIKFLQLCEDLCCALCALFYLILTSVL